MKLRSGLHAALCALGLIQGILASLVYSHTSSGAMLVFCICSMLLAAYELCVCLLRALTSKQRVPGLVAVCVLTYLVFLASLLAQFITLASFSTTSSSRYAPDFIDGNSIAVIQSLALISTFLMGSLVSLELCAMSHPAPEDDFSSSSEKSAAASNANRLRDPEAYLPPPPACAFGSSDLTPMSTQDESAGKVPFYKGSETQVHGYVHNPSPPVAVPVNMHSSSSPSDSPNFHSPARPLRNKDSEKTLTECDISEEITADLLVRASMAGADFYDENIDNWMDTRADSIHSKTNAKPSSESPSSKDNLHVTGPLKIKKLRSKKSLALKSDGLPTLQESTSQTPDLTSLDRQSSNEDPSLYVPFDRATNPSNETTLSRSHDKKSDLQPRSKIHRKSNSWSSSLVYSPVTSAFNLQSTSALNETRSASPKKSSFMVASPDSPSFPSDIHVQESPAFDDPHKYSRKRAISECSLGSDLKDLDDITRAVPSWKIPTEAPNSIRNVSLDYWEANKGSWVAGSNQGRPLVFMSSSIEANDSAYPPLNTSSKNLLSITSIKAPEVKSDRLYDANSDRSISAPSLHTYRELHDVQSKPSGNTFNTSEHMLYRPSTPPMTEQGPPPLAHHASSRSLAKNQYPYQSHTSTSKGEPAPHESSPIRKMIGKLKMSGESSFNMHKHSSSLATSMISSTSNFSSKSGSPRKAIKSLFSRSSFDHGKRLSFSQTATSPTATSFSQSRYCRAGMFENNVHSFNFGAKNENHATDKFWEFEPADSDKSRVSSMPSAIIGEYDKEKWRTLKELELEN